MAGIVQTYRHSGKRDVPTLIRSVGEQHHRRQCGVRRECLFAARIGGTDKLTTCNSFGEKEAGVVIAEMLIRL